MTTKYLYLFLFISIYMAKEVHSQSLPDYQKIAIENNPGLQAKYKNFEAALEKVPQVNNLEDPILSFGVFFSTVSPQVDPQTAKFILTQMFPWFGTLQAQSDVASIMAEAKYQEYLDARNKLNYQVSAAYYPLYELHSWQNIEQENIGILESYKVIATSKFENNQSAMVDVLRVDIMLKDATTNLIVLNKQKKSLEARFNKLLNRAYNDSVIIVDTLKIPDLSMDYRRDSLFVSNPILDEISLKIKASESSERAAIKQGLPKIGVSLEYVFMDNQTDIPMGDMLMPMVSASVPIFRRKYRAAQKEAQLMQESYTLQKEDLVNQLTGSYEMVWFELQKQQELLDLYDHQIMESKQSLNLLFSAYSNSGKDFEEVLRMQQQLLAYQKLKVTALVEFQIALAEMDYLTSKTQ